MDGKLTLTVVTPERAVVSKVECDEVTLPAELGQLGILPGHTPLITLLGIGVVTYRDGHTKTSLAVRDGFAEIAGDQVRILADQAATRDAIDQGAAASERHAADLRRADVVGDEQLNAVNADAAFADAKLQVASN